MSNNIFDCLESKIRIYNINAVRAKIVYNKYGDHDPNGLLYVLPMITRISWY